MPRLASISRAALALLLGAGLLGTSLETHTEHDLTHAPILEGRTVSAVCHPKQALHIEASEMVSVPPCPACLVHLETSAPGLGLARSLAEPTVSGRPPFSPPLPRLATWHLAGPSRAPPRA